MNGGLEAGNSMELTQIIQNEAIHNIEFSREDSCEDSNDSKEVFESTLSHLEELLCNEDELQNLIDAIGTPSQPSLKRDLNFNEISTKDIPVIDICSSDDDLDEKDEAPGIKIPDDIYKSYLTSVDVDLISNISKFTENSLFSEDSPKLSSIVSDFALSSKVESLSDWSITIPDTEVPLPNPPPPLDFFIHDEPKDKDAEFICIKSSPSNEAVVSLSFCDVKSAERKDSIDAEIKYDSASFRQHYEVDQEFDENSMLSSCSDVNSPSPQTEELLLSENVPISFNSDVLETPNCPNEASDLVECAAKKATEVKPLGVQGIATVELKPVEQGLLIDIEATVAVKVEPVEQTSLTDFKATTAVEVKPVEQTLLTDVEATTAVEVKPLEQTLLTDFEATTAVEVKPVEQPLLTDSEATASVKVEPVEQILLTDFKAKEGACFGVELKTEAVEVKPSVPSCSVNFDDLKALEVKPLEPSCSVNFDDLKREGEASKFDSNSEKSCKSLLIDQNNEGPSWSKPWISTDDAENADNNDPEWDVFRKLQTDEERYRAVRERWRQLEIPDPRRDLTRHNFRRTYNQSSKQIANVSKGNGIEDRQSRKRTRSLDPHHDRENPSKRRRMQSYNELFDMKINSLHQQLDEEFASIKQQQQRALIDLSKHQERDWERFHSSRAPQEILSQQWQNLQCRQVREVEDLQREYRARVDAVTKVKMHSIDLLSRASEEVLTFNKFYHNLNNSEGDHLHITEEERQQFEDTEYMYEVFNAFYSK